MNAPVECLRCKGSMIAGMVLDRGDLNIGGDQQWVEGAPRKSFWTGLKTKGRESYAVHTYRCAKCGYLESYATDPLDR